MEFSSPLKNPSLGFIDAGFNFVEEIPHQHCHCFHCINNTKPLPIPQAQRLTSKNERKVNDSQAYRIILRNLSQFGFSGAARAPDIFLMDTFTLVYSNKIGRMKSKEGMPNLEVKRHFDEQRRKGQALQTTQGHLSNLLMTGVSMVESVPVSLLPVKAPKQIAVMCYRDNTEQLMTQSLLSKILEKRKNDPYWEQISHILQLPPEMKQPIKHQYHYKRTVNTLPQLIPVLDRMAAEIDSQEEKALIRNNSPREQEEEPEINPQIKLTKPSSQRIARSSSLSPKSRKQQSLQDSLLSGLAAFEERVLQLGAASFEMVAFLEVTSRIRILNAVFQYFVDEKGRLFLASTKDVVLQQLQGQEITLIHDRYHPLQQLGGEQLVAAKKVFDRTEEQQLWKICTAVVNECLQIRKIQLKLTDYKKPSQQILLAIFLKIFPDFKSEAIFSSINWKNQLGNLVGDIRTRVNKIIRQDEGIRILRRFNIHFRRTFH